jgi:uncharacterized protein involved in outer membrane biogenesis
MRKVFIGATALVALIIVVLVGFGLFFDVNRYKPQIEAAVTKSSGMNLKINGKASLKVFPRIHIALKDVHLSNQGIQLFAVNEIQVAPRLIPFALHKEVVVDSFSMMSPQITIEKTAKGRMNYETASQQSKKQTVQEKKGAAGESGKKESAMGAGSVRSVKIRDAEISYLDRKTGQKTVLKDLDADLSDIAWNALGTGVGANTEFIKSIRFKGDVQAKSLTSDKLVVSNLKTKVRNERGVLQLNPTEANALGGAVRGSAQVDIRGDSPKVKIAQTATGLDLNQLEMKGKERFSGIVDASLNLSASGDNATALTRSSNGNVSVRSKDVTLIGINIDNLANQLKSAKGLELAQLSSSLLTGVMGKQTQNASGAEPKKSGEKTVIRNLVSDWQIVQGVAQTKDVALSTGKTTVAFQGRVNLVNETYQGFQVAMVDPQGCSKNKIAIAGSITKPRPAEGAVEKQVTESAMGAAAGILGGKLGSQLKKSEEKAPEEKKSSECDHFYEGAALRG